MRKGLWRTCAFSTSAAYRREFLGSDGPRAYVVPATWIDQDIILTDTDAEAEWTSKGGEDETYSLSDD